MQSDARHHNKEDVCTRVFNVSTSAAHMVTWLEFQQMAEETPACKISISPSAAGNPKFLNLMKISFLLICYSDLNTAPHT